MANRSRESMISPSEGGDGKSGFFLRLQVDHTRALNLIQQSHLPFESCGVAAP